MEEAGGPRPFTWALRGLVTFMGSVNGTERSPAGVWQDSGKGRGEGLLLPILGTA